MSPKRPIISKVDPLTPEPSAIDRAAQILLAGGLVAFPTETVYGLGANGLDAAAVAGIFAAKRRPEWNPVILHVNGIGDATKLTEGSLSPTELRLLETYWPGPLTLVVRRAACVPDIVAASGPTVGLRAPAHPVAQALIRAAGVPIAAPSANIFMGVSPTSAEHVVRSLGDRVDVVLDGGDTTVGIESTVCRAVGEEVMILRAGGVTREMLLSDGFVVAVSEVARNSDSSENHDERQAAPEPAPSPGLHARHYAPDSKLTVVEGDTEFVRRTLSAHAYDEGIGFIVTPSAGESLRSANVPKSRIIELTSNDADARLARDLYRALHEADARVFRETLLIFPAPGPFSAAIRDRLRRASDGWIQQHS